MITEIIVREHDGNRSIQFPILPETIKASYGETVFATYSIMDKGDVAEPTGTGLASYSWDSFFPSRKDSYPSMLHGKFNTPSAYHLLIEDWKKKGTHLVLIVMGFYINKDVYVSDYTGDLSGAFGDLPYSIEFKEKRSIYIQKTVNKTQTQTKRTAKKTTSYTIKKGDTLWGIAKQFLGAGSKWETIYEDNKTIIEQTAKKYGKSSSEHGWWIFPGVKLTINQ